MSKRRNPGDVVRKVPGAGFVGESLVCRIPDYFGDIPEPCFASLHRGEPDDECMEWPNLEVLDANGDVVGHCCHVAECEMEDLDPDPKTRGEK